MLMFIPKPIPMESIGQIISAASNVSSETISMGNDSSGGQ